MGKPSIIQDENEQSCFLCGCSYWLERHHTWHGTSNRRLADEDGLTVKLCHSCHSNLHDMGIKDRYLMQIAEKAYLDHYNATIEDFIGRYGKNVL